MSKTLSLHKLEKEKSAHKRKMNKKTPKKVLLVNWWIFFPNCCCLGRGFKHQWRWRGNINRYLVKRPGKMCARARACVSVFVKHTYMFHLRLCLMWLNINHFSIVIENYKLGVCFFVILHYLECGIIVLSVSISCIISDSCVFLHLSRL